MKKRLLFTALIGMFLFVNPLMAQEDSSATENVEMMAEGAEEMDSSAQEEVQMEEAVEEVVTEVEEAIAPVEEAEDDGFFANVEKVTQEIKKKFIDGGHYLCLLYSLLYPWSSAFYRKNHLLKPCYNKHREIAAGH